MSNFDEKKEKSEDFTRKALGKIKEKKIPRMVQPQSGTNITNNTYFSEGDIYTSDALKAEIRCLKKALQEKERIISILKEEIEILKGIVKKD